MSDPSPKQRMSAEGQWYMAYGYAAGRFDAANDTRDGAERFAQLYKEHAEPYEFGQTTVIPMDVREAWANWNQSGRTSIEQS